MLVLQADIRIWMTNINVVTQREQWLHLPYLQKNHVHHFGKINVFPRISIVIHSLQSHYRVQYHLTRKYYITGGASNFLKWFFPRKISDYSIFYFPVVQCNFDQGSLCSFTNGRNDDFDWTIRRGSTPSIGTGPTSDVSGNGNYLMPIQNIILHHTYSACETLLFLLVF